MNRECMNKVMTVAIVLLVVYMLCKDKLERLMDPYTIFYYHNPNCGYCVKFNPTWDLLVQQPEAKKRFKFKHI